MDTLTHAISGALVARLLCAAPPPGPPALTARGGLATSTPGRWRDAWGGSGAGAVTPWQAVTVGLLAGAFPDLDSIARWAGEMAYLRHHRGITHSVLLAPLWALGLAWLLSRCWPSLRRRPGGWKPLWPLALAALLLHIAGDWITQFGTMMLEPLSDRRFGLGAMFIIDLSFSGILLVALLLALLLPQRRWPSALGLALASGWVVLAWIGKQEAQGLGERWARAQGVAAQWVETMPRPASPFNWTVMVFDGSRYHVAHLNTRRTQPLVAGPDAHFIRRFSAPYLPAAQASWQVVPKFGVEGTPAWVQQAWSHPELAVFRWFAVAPALVSAAETPLPGGGVQRCAMFRDLRFEFPGRERSPFRYGVCLAPDGRASLQVG